MTDNSKRDNTKTSIKVIETKTSLVYGDALYEAILEEQEKNDSPNLLDEIYAQLHACQIILLEDKQVASFFLSRIIHVADKVSIFKEAFVSAEDAHLKLNRISQNFLCILIERSLLSLLGAILNRFLYLSDKNLSRLRLTLWSVEDLKEDLSSSLNETLSKRFNKEIILHQDINKKLLGGFALEGHSFYLDMSWKHHFDLISQKLYAEQIKEGDYYEN